MSRQTKAAPHCPRRCSAAACGCVRRGMGCVALVWLRRMVHGRRRPRVGEETDGARPAEKAAGEDAGTRQRETRAGKTQPKRKRVGAAAEFSADRSIYRSIREIFSRGLIYTSI